MIFNIGDSVMAISPAYPDGAVAVVWNYCGNGMVGVRYPDYLYYESPFEVLHCHQLELEKVRKLTKLDRALK